MKEVAMEMGVGTGLRDVKEEEPTTFCGLCGYIIYSRESICTEPKLHMSNMVQEGAW